MQDQALNPVEIQLQQQMLMWDSIKCFRKVRYGQINLTISILSMK